MKKLFVLFLLLLNFLPFLRAQDTITVSTLTYDSITTRRGYWVFPDTTHHYRKILMEYSLKCDPATTADGYSCGEWDYLTYTTLYEHTGALDSNLIVLDSLLFGVQNPDSFLSASTPAYSLYESHQATPIIDSLINETTYTVGNNPYFADLSDFDQGIGRIQIFWPDSLIQQSGLFNDSINALSLNFQNQNIAAGHLTIKLKNLSQKPLQFENSGFTEVYSAPLNIQNQGWTKFVFSQAFQYTTAGGILAEFSFSNLPVDSILSIRGTEINDSLLIFSAEKDQTVKAEGSRWISVPVQALNQQISDQISIAFWQYGDPEIQPQNDYIFEAYDEDGKRTLNCHLPWSNGSVYWDAGNTGGSYDRIYKAAQSYEYKGQWNFWVLTKNVSTGNMKMYLNGQLWHSGNGKTKPINTISVFNIASNGKNTSFYDGYLNEFSIWNKELDLNEVQQIMYEQINPSDTLFSNLVSYYSMDDEAGSPYVEDLSQNSNTAFLMGGLLRADVDADHLYMKQQYSTFLPDVQFLQGNYFVHYDSLILYDTLYESPMSVVNFEIGNHEAHPVDTIWTFEAGWFYQYNSTGEISDSSYFQEDEILTNQEISYYEEPFEVINPWEIGRFITPYGIGLDLGPDGFTWIYDVSDYAPLLHDTVELSAGNQQELIRLTFKLIEGTPGREVQRIDPIWGFRGSRKFSSLAEDISLQNKSIALLNSSDSYKVKTRLTGHGHNTSNSGYPHCCEWWDNTHYLLVDFDTVAEWHIWQEYDCAQNPVYPQGGTWPGSREGWCPGDKVKENEFEITPFVTSDSVNIDYTISEVPSWDPGMGNGNYVMDFQLIEYGPKNFNLDAEIVDILSPNNLGYYSRFNPICYDPKIELKNSGKEAITEISFDYKVIGGTNQNYTWTGNLQSMEKMIIQLPVEDESFWNGNGSNLFKVHLASVNGQTDDYQDNDDYTTHFDLPDVYNFPIIFLSRTNNIPSDNWYEVYDMDGNVVMSRYYTDPNTTYYDTLDLPNGCYTLCLVDSGLDGLSYWAYPEQGSGYFKIKKVGGSIAKQFEAEFGHKILYSFTLDNELSASYEEKRDAISIYPNPAKNILHVDCSKINGKTTVSILDLQGRKLITKENLANNGFYQQIDISSLASGPYIVRIEGEKINHFESFIVD